VDFVLAVLSGLIVLDHGWLVVLMDGTSQRTG
jgi:hypothetical protein